jgi:site-specific recombinase XerD
MSGKPLYEVQKLLGHANYSMTERYAHLSPEYLKGATDGLDFSLREGAKILKMVR